MLPILHEAYAVPSAGGLVRPAQLIGQKRTSILQRLHASSLLQIVTYETDESYVSCLSCPCRFGINYVDFKDPSRPRYAKDSSKYLSKHFFSVGKSGLQPKAVHKNKFLPRPKYSPPETSKLLLKAKPKSASKKDSERKPAHNSRFKAHP